MAAPKNATSKSQTSNAQQVTLRLDLSLYGEGRAGKLGESWIAGRLVARRPDWDKPVELGKGVTLVRGGFRRWDGTHGSPALGSEYPTVVDIHGLPVAAAEKAAREYPIITRIVAAKGETTVGAWQRTDTQRTPGLGARARAKVHERPEPKVGAPSAAGKSAARPAAKAKAAPATKAKAAPAPKARPAAKPAPARKAKPAAKPARPKAKARPKARPAPKPKARAKVKAKPARRPARKVARPAKARRGKRGRR